MTEPPVQSAVDHIHAHPRHTGFRALDLVLAVSAVFISGVSLYVATEHGRTERELVQANSWPILQEKAAFNAKGLTVLSVRNSGVGPAKLEYFEVLYKGHPIHSTHELLLQCCNVPATPEAENQAFVDGASLYSISGDVLRPGEDETFIRLVGSPQRHDAGEKFVAASYDLKFRACYCSVFDQCWMSDLQTLRPSPVGECPTETVAFNVGRF